MTSRISRRPWLIKTGIIFVLVGINGILVPFMSFTFINRSQFENQVSQLIHAQTPDTISSPTPSLIISTPEPDYELRDVRNRLIMRKAGIDMPVFAGESEKTLSKGAWIFPRTSTPDKGGNTVIFGHRFKYLPPVSNTMFHLDKIADDDEFTLEWNDVTYRYRVAEIKIVEPNDLSVLAPTKKRTLTLITCTPLFSTAQRLVVIAELIREER